MLRWILISLDDVHYVDDMVVSTKIINNTSTNQITQYMSQQRLFYAYEW